jgi:hypothetical protein
MFAAAMVAALMVVSSPSAVCADEPSKEDVARFKELAKEGTKLRNDGELWQALAKYEEARQYVDHPKLVINIGKLKQKTGACKEARSLYREVLARPKLPDDVRLETVEQLEASEDCTAFSTLVIECDPADANVTLGKYEFSCPATKRVRPGDYEAVVSAAGFSEESIDLPLEPGKRLQRRVELQPGAGESVDLVGAEDSGADQPVDWMRYGAYAGVGVGAGLLIGGLVSDYGAQARQEEFLAANEAGNFRGARQLKAEAESAQTRTIILYSAGAVLAAGGAVLWVLDSSDDESEGRVRAGVGWTEGGPAVRGMWSW